MWPRYPDPAPVERCDAVHGELRCRRARRHRSYPDGDTRRRHHAFDGHGHFHAWNDGDPPPAPVERPDRLFA